MPSSKAIVITGPTASGKTSMAVSLAETFCGEIISADSRQVYKGLDLGTGKDLSEYSKNGTKIEYHLIDIVEPHREYNLKQFNIDARTKIKELLNKGKTPFVTGGSPLYIDSLVSNYSFPLPPPDINLRKRFKEAPSEEIAEYLKTNYPAKYEELENKNSRPRIVRLLEEVEGIAQASTEGSILNESFSFLIIAPYYERKEIHRRIENRLDSRLSEGMIDEVDGLHSAGLSWERLDSFGLEYRYISKFLKKELSFQEMRNTLLARIRQFAKSQDVWFRKMEKSGKKIYWIRNGDIAEAADLIRLFLSGQPLEEPKIRISEIFYGEKSKN